MVLCVPKSGSDAKAQAHNYCMSQEDEEILPFDSEPVVEEEEDIELPDYPYTPPNVQEVGVDDIQLLDNVRSDPDTPEALTENIRVQGLLHPIVVRPSQDKSHGKTYELVVGYRRLSAFKALEYETIPASVHEASDEQVLAELISENLQREDPSPLDEARVMKRMIDTFNWSHAQVAAQLGVDRSQVTKRLGLLRLPDKVQTLVADGSLTASHAEVVARLDNEDSQVELAELAIKKEAPVSKLHSYATKIKERDDQQIEQSDPEAQPEDAQKPLDTISDDQVVDLPALKVKSELSPEELTRVDLYILLRAGNDEEMLSVLEERYGVTYSELFDWTLTLDDGQVSEMRETMIRRWLSAAHRFPTLPSSLQEMVGDGMSSLFNEPEPEIPAEPEEFEEDFDDLEDWGDDEL